MEDKVVLVTGSTSGIGEATALSFAKLGCKVVIHGTNQDRIGQVALKCEEISPKRYKPLTITGDLREACTAEKLIIETLREHGMLDILINNAGLFQPCSIDSPDAYKNFSNLMAINLNSAVQLTILAVPHLKRAKGCIVNVSSNLHAKCIGGGFAYCTTKAALTMFTKSIACDLAPDVRVNSVSPGPVATRMPARCGVDVEEFRNIVGRACLVNRVGEPEEIARIIVMLASPESAFITGSDFIIDGGSTIKPEGKALAL